MYGSASSLPLRSNGGQAETVAAQGLARNAGIRSQRRSHGFKSRHLHADSPLGESVCSLLRKLRLGGLGCFEASFAIGGSARRKTSPRGSSPVRPRASLPLGVVVLASRLAFLVSGGHAWGGRAERGEGSNPVTSTSRETLRHGSRRSSWLRSESRWHPMSLWLEAAHRGGAGSTK